MKNRVKKDMMTAMKEKNVVARDILRVLKGEIERYVPFANGKVEMSDAVIVKMVKKLIETGTPDEIEVLEVYLPQQMSRDSLVEQVAGFMATHQIHSIKEMGKIMGYFKKNFEGTYDGGELSKIVKQLLN